MTNDEPTQQDSDAADARTEPIDESATTREPAPAQARSRWSGVSEPARRHPIGAALLAAGVGLLIGFGAGTAADVHPMLSLTVGTTPDGPAAVMPDGGPGPGHPPPPDRGRDPAHRPPPPGAEAGRPGDRGPGGAEAPVPPPPPGPGGPGSVPPPPAGPDAGQNRLPTPPGGERTPVGPASPPALGGGTSAPLPAERPASFGA